MSTSIFIRGCFKTDKPVSIKLMEYINQFALIRHMKRDNRLIRKLYPDWQEHCWCNTLGSNGEFFVGGKGLHGDDFDESILDYDYPEDCPDLWCQWVMPDNCTIIWDGGEKFHEPAQWLRYLITHFFEPDHIRLNGTVGYDSDDLDSSGIIRVTDNQVTVVPNDIYIPADALVEQLYTPAEFAKLLHVTRRRLEIWEESHKLIPYRSTPDTCWYTQTQLELCLPLISYLKG